MGPAIGQNVPETARALFGLDRMWDVHITMEGEAWDSLYPPYRRRSGFGGSSRFPYAKAQLRIAGHTLDDVGIRFKGQSTFTYSRGTMKRSFKLDFDRFVPNQEFVGLKKLNLNNNVTDPTQIRESITYGAYRDAGVAAPRTGFSRVYVTIRGVCKGEYLGMYTIVEQFDRRAMKRWFGSKNGLLVKPRTVLAYYGDAWSTRYESSYNPKTEASEASTAPLIGLARLMQLDDASFAAGLEEVLDVEQFFSYLAVTVITANTDSPLNLSHNFYLAVPERKNKVVWIPWDTNLSLGGWGRAGPDQDRLSIVTPSRMAFVQRVFDVGVNEDRYRTRVAELIAGSCSAAALRAHIEIAQKTTADAIEQEAKRSEMVTYVERDRSRPRDISRFGGSLTLTEFVGRREASVLAQLAGVSPGIPGGTFRNFSRNSRVAASAPAPSDSSSRVRMLLSRVPLPRAKNLFDRMDVIHAAEQVFFALDADGSQSLDATEFAAGISGDADAAYLERRRRRHGRSIVRDLDSGPGSEGEGDGRISIDEFRSGIATWFPAWDRDRNGKLTRRELRGLGGTR